MPSLNPDCLQYRLTDEERQTFNDTGLLYVRNALSPEQVEQGFALTERVHQTKLAEGTRPAQGAVFIPTSYPMIPISRIWSTTSASCPRYGGFWAGISFCIMPI